jgi:hypothetical protein
MNNSSAQPGTSIVMVVLGVLAIVMAFVATGMSGAFSRSGPTRPLTLAGRVIAFLTGLVLVGTGLYRLLK